MPELPEVESVRRGLSKQLVGQGVRSVWWSGSKLRRTFAIAELRETLQGASFAGLRRVGKYLLLDMGGTTPGYLLVHLGMSGKLAVCASDAPRVPHTHVVLGLSDGRELRFVDPRRFGLLVWVHQGEDDPSLAKMGPDPLAPDFVPRAVERIKTRRGPIKHVIMDQSVVAGVGNIYACEALWRAGVRPARAASRVSRARIADLAAALVAVMEAATEAGGTTLRDHAKPDGSPGGYAVALDVYGREGAPCGRCGRPVMRSVMAGRSTFWCPGCQR